MKSAKAAARVVQTIELTVVDFSGSMFADLCYETRDPFSVALMFRTDAGESIAWSFGLELLTAGMIWPTGDGDVHIAPDAIPGTIDITLSSPSGRAFLFTDKGDLATFLKKVYELRPADSAAVVDAALDAEITDILNDGGIW